MPFGNAGKRKTPLGVLIMMAALVLAAFLGAAVGLVLENATWFQDDPEHEIVTAETPAS